MAEIKRGSVGVHVDRREHTGGIDSSIRRTLQELPGSRCCQIFTHGPQSRSMNRFNTEDLQSLCAEADVYVHSTYFTTWKAAAFDHMQEQFTVAASLGARGVVLHLVKQTPAEHIAVMNRLRLAPRARGSVRAQEFPFPLVILEMQAFKPDQWTYQTADEVNQLCDALHAAGWGPDRAVICLDTAHIDAGRIPLRTADDAQRYIAALRRPEYIGLLHLNGNAYNCMERARDKHCVPLSADDWIWHRARDAGAAVALADSGIRVLIDWFVSRGRDVILEQDFTPELVAFYKSL